MRISVLIVGLASASFAQKVQKPPAAATTCYTMIQNYANVPNIPFFAADVPAGATDLHPVFAVKGPQATNPWVTCSPSTTCNGALLPNMSTPGADPDDGAVHYSAFVTPQTAVSGPFAFASPRYVRLVSQYTMTSPTCVSESSFEVAANADFAIQMVVPPGKTITRITTFMRELFPGHHWMQCDDWVNPAAGNVVGRGCAGQLLIYAYVTQPPDPSDHAQSVLMSCINKIVGPTITTASSNRRGCRVRLQY
jgi:hypothetical protein